MSTRSDAEIIDIVIRLLFLGLFVYLALKLVAPLFGLMLWAVILCVAVYPVYRWLADRLGGRETLSAVLITLLGLAITLGPVALLTTGVIDSATRLVVSVQSGQLALPSADRLREVWLVGPWLANGWETLDQNLGAVVSKIGPSLLSAGTSILRRIASIGLSLLMLSASVVIMGLLFKPGPGDGAQRPALCQSGVRAAWRRFRRSGRGDGAQCLARGDRGGGDPVAAGGGHHGCLRGALGRSADAGGVVSGDHSGWRRSGGDPGDPLGVVLHEHRNGDRLHGGDGAGSGGR